MTSAIGRLVVDVLTNQSGGSVALYDLVYIDTAHDSSFTTGTTGAYTGMVGVCIEPNGIANGASGRIQIGGPCAGINLNASGTRGHFVKTHTVAKQATDAGASRVVGAFGQLKASGTSPVVELFGFPDAASSSASAGTPAVVLGTAAASGSAATFVATDATLIAFDATSPSTQALGDAAVVGVATVAARRDHKHAMPAASSILGNVLGTTTYTRGSDNFLGSSTTSTSLVDVDSTNAIVTFTAPASGNVLVMMSCAAFPGSQTLFVGLRESTTNVGAQTLASGVTAAGAHNTWFWIITGISAGSHTYKAAQCVGGGTAGGLGSGPTYGPIVLVVAAL